MSIAIDLGGREGDSLADGSLRPLSDQEIADRAFRSPNGQWLGPAETWVKDFSGQITLGRIGRPVYRYAPLDWWGAERKVRVLKILTAPAPRHTSR